MRFGVVVFPGTWSDCDFHYVISEVLHQPVKYVWHRDRDLSGFDCVVLPGGFSYGDYLRAGAVAGRSPVVESLPDFYPEAHWQRCVVHFYRNVFTVVPRGKAQDVDRAVQEAKEGAVLLRKKPLHRRAEILSKTSQTLLKAQDERQVQSFQRKEQLCERRRPLTV